MVGHFDRCGDLQAYSYLIPGYGIELISRKYGEKQKHFRKRAQEQVLRDRFRV